MITEEMKERILRQLTLKSRKLVHGEGIENSDGLYGDGRDVCGDGTGKWGDITEIKGDITEVGAGDLSRFIGSMKGIRAEVGEMIALLESAGKVIRHPAI